MVYKYVQIRISREMQIPTNCYWHITLRSCAWQFWIIFTSVSCRAKRQQNLGPVCPSGSKSWSGSLDLRRGENIDFKCYKEDSDAHRFCNVMLLPAPSSPWGFCCLWRKGKRGWEGLKGGPPLPRHNKNKRKRVLFCFGSRQIVFCLEKKNV